MNRILAAATFGVLAFGFTACGNSSGQGTQNLPSLPQIHKNFTLMCDLLRALKANGVNCANIKNDGIRMVREEGDCIFNAQSVTVDLFTNTDLGNQITKALASLAGGYRLHPDNNWSLNTQDEATALKLSKLLNIKIS